AALELDRDALVALVTPDPAALIAAWRETIADLAPGADGEMVRRTRTMSKDLLRCLRGIALRQGAAYEPGVERIHEQVVRYLPHCRVLADSLLQAYRQPTTEKTAAMELIDDAERVLVPT
nr:hypothetical protein [Micromonospora sp. DSM 115978]